MAFVPRDPEFQLLNICVGRKLEGMFGLEGSGIMHQQSHKPIFSGQVYSSFFTQDDLKEPSSSAVNRIPSSCGGLICLFLNHSY